MGRVLTANGSLYEGFWANNLKEGKGRMISVDGDVYEGDWKAGKKSGDGKLSYSNG
jgi:hypothetical protein